MTPRTAVTSRNALAALVVIAWAISAHLASAGVGPADLRVAVALTPLVPILAWLAQYRLSRSFRVVIYIVASAATAWSWPWLRTHVTWVFCLLHLDIHLLLAAWFGRSLLPGRDALITSMSRRMDRQPLSNRKERYTRGVTWLWTLFFLFNGAVSLLLFALTPVEIWSVHANLLTGPLVALVFLGETLVRKRMLPPAERPSLRAVVRFYRAATSATVPTHPKNSLL